MSAKRACLAVAVGLLALYGMVILAEETKDVGEARVKKLVLQLGDAEFLKRENAEQTLIKLGTGNLSALKDSQKDAKDAEVTQRLKRVVDYLETKSRIETATDGRFDMVGESIKALTKDNPETVVRVVRDLADERQKVYLWQALNEELVIENSRRADEIVRLKDALLKCFKDLQSAKAAGAAIKSQDSAAQAETTVDLKTENGKLKAELAELKEKMQRQSAAGFEAQMTQDKIIQFTRKDLMNLMMEKVTARSFNIAPALGRLLEVEDWSIRWKVARDLGELGEAAKGQTAALRRRFGDDSRIVRAYAAHALWKIEGDTKEPLSVLIESLRSDATARPVCAELLADMGAKLPEIPAKLAEYVQDQDEDTAWHAAWSLRRMGKQAQSAVPTLKKAAQDKRTRVQLAAEEALREIE